jgi:hypothetical protein
MRILIAIILSLSLSSCAYGTTYYVKNGGNDALDGLSDANAWETIAQVNAATFSAGDEVLFRKGDVFRDTIITPGGNGTGGTEDILSADTSGYITYGAYGTGSNPIIQNSVAADDVGDWTDLGGNIWQTTGLSLPEDVGNVIFDDGDVCGVKRFEEVDIADDLDYWYDSVNELVKISSTSNPATRFSSIELTQKHSASALSNRSYLIFENLTYQFNGNTTLFGGGTSHIIVRNCTFRFNGGCIQSGTTRYGGGIGTWNSGNNWIVENCIFDNEYDAACTNQGNGNNSVLENIIWRNNLISNCEYSFEFWINNITGNVKNVYFVNNTCINAGGGWGHTQRSDPNGRHVMLYANTATMSTPVVICNNIFDIATESGIWLWTSADITDYEIDNNCWNVTTLARIGWLPITNYTTLADWQAISSQDANSISQDPLFRSATDYRLQSSSPCIDSGINLDEVTDDYYSTPRPLGGQTDIGATEYYKAKVRGNATLRHSTI